MPIYEFTCKKCSQDFEEIVRLSDREPPPCPKCGAKDTQRILSPCASRVGGGSPGTSCSSPGGFS